MLQSTIIIKESDPIHLAYKAYPDRVDTAKIDDRMDYQQEVAFNQSLLSIFKGIGYPISICFLIKQIR